MKIRLHEIELGAADVQNTAGSLQRILGLQPKLEQAGLAVLNANLPGFDLNISTHFPKGIVALSFLTDDLAEVEQRLQQEGLSYQGPQPSHLGMTMIQFNDASGYIIRINTPGQDSPAWLTNSLLHLH